MAERLTPTQRRHLEELRLVALARGRGEAYWYPSGSSEHRSAEALRRRGYVSREYGHGSVCYSLARAGMDAAALERSGDGPKLMDGLAPLRNPKPDDVKPVRARPLDGDGPDGAKADLNPPIRGVILRLPKDAA